MLKIKNKTKRKGEYGRKNHIKNNVYNNIVIQRVHKTEVRKKQALCEGYY